MTEGKKVNRTDIPVQLVVFCTLNVFECSNHSLTYCFKPLYDRETWEEERDGLSGPKLIEEVT
jgi:hypothetical protein